MGCVREALNNPWRHQTPNCLFLPLPFHISAVRTSSPNPGREEDMQSKACQLEPHRTGFIPAFCYLLVMWPWASSFTSGSLNFLIC